MAWHYEDHTVAISGGVGSFSTDHPWRGLLWHAVISPATQTTSYVCTMNDRKGDPIVIFTDTGDTFEALETPVLGTYTFDFTAVSADENIRVRTACKDTANY